MTIFVKCGILFTSTILFPLCKSVKLAISKCTEKIKSISEKCKNTNEELDKKVSLQKKNKKLSVYGLLLLLFCLFLFFVILPAIDMEMSPPSFG